MPSRPARPPHICTVAGCQLQIPRSQLMCREHWLQTPRPLRTAINATWRNRKAEGLASYSANVLEARRWHAENPLLKDRA